MVDAQSISKLKNAQARVNKGLMLLPDCIDDLIGQDNPVRVIDAFIDSLDIDKIRFPKSSSKPHWQAQL